MLLMIIILLLWQIRMSLFESLMTTHTPLLFLFNEVTADIIVGDLSYPDLQNDSTTIPGAGRHCRHVNKYRHRPSDRSCCSLHDRQDLWKPRIAQRLPHRGARRVQHQHEHQHAAAASQHGYSRRVAICTYRPGPYHQPSVIDRIAAMSIAAAEMRSAFPPRGASRVGGRHGEARCWPASD